MISCPWQKRPFAWLAVVALALGACSEGNVSPVDGEDTDTTAPTIAGTTPAYGQVGVGAFADVLITFDEAMDPASATGQVTLTSGGTATVTWLTDRRFSIAHAVAWPAGAEVRVGLGTGLTDLAGNALAAPHELKFFVETSELLLLSTEPADGSADVPRSASVRLQFSHPVDQASLEAGVTIADASTKATYPFTVGGGAGFNWYTLDPTATLAAGTLITVSVGGSVHVLGSPLNTLGDAAGFAFTTGLEAGRSGRSPR